MARSPLRRLTMPITAIAAVAVVAGLAPLAPAALASPSQFGASRVTSVGSSPAAVAIGDVTGDGIADVVMTTGYSNTTTDFKLFVFAGLADGTLAAPVSYATAGTYSSRPGSVAVGDINGDGRVDVVVGVSGVGIQLFPQAAEGTLGTPTLVSSRDSDRLVVGPFDKSGRAQVAGIGWGSNTVTVFADTGAGLAIAGTYAARHGGYDDLEAADVTGDGLTDAVVMSGQLYADPNLSVLAQQASGGVCGRRRVHRRREHPDEGDRRRRRDR